MPNIIQQLDGVCFALQEAHDFAWLHAYGSVFCAFDQQDSGNICFGVTDGAQRWFIKYAGASAVNCNRDPQEAILRLQRASPVYQELAHPVLVRPIEHGPRGAGYVCVYAWADGECLHAHWDFDRHPKYEHPQSPNYRFRHLPLEKKLACLDDIYQFHLLVAAKGYVAIDFYDGCIMYDFATGKTTICDIDFYQQQPCTNEMGRMWGSSRFMSPEEFELGAIIDEVTNVFTMGATAFELLGSNRNRSIQEWTAPESLYRVAARATNAARSLRYQSLTEFHGEWQQAVARTMP